MSKKYYIKFAEYIRENLKATGDIQAARAQYNCIVHVALRDNPKFNPEKFRNACGL